MKSQVKFEIICIVHMLTICMLISLAALNIKEQYYIAGIQAIIMALILVMSLAKLIRHFKSERPEKKG